MINFWKKVLRKKGIFGKFAKGILEDLSEGNLEANPKYWIYALLNESLDKSLMEFVQEFSNKILKLLNNFMEEYLKNVWMIC